MEKGRKSSLGRRGFLQGLGAAVLGLNLSQPWVVRGNQVGSAPEKSGAKRMLRIAHMTDLHIQPERGAAQGLTAALHHVQSLEDRPDLIITGGDTVMDSLGQDNARTTTQWELFHKIMKDECSLPVKSCIGNHDVWGWNKERSQTTGDEALWGKKRAVEELGLPNRYYSFDRAGWHFIILDSTFPDEEHVYIAKMDDAQYEWLVSDLAATDASTPVLLMTHEPIFSSTPLFYAENDSAGSLKLSPRSIHVDLTRLRDLFKQHPNIKLALSGHTHQVDRVDYCGITYLCDGAVSGAWWKGDHRGFDEGYGLVDLYDDGSFANQYVAYNWTPIEEPASKA